MRPETMPSWPRALARSMTHVKENTANTAGKKHRLATQHHPASAEGTHSTDVTEKKSNLTKN
ncbi:hypothetical protein EYF80_048229 [Liparis tanakae]|uniref:Uncharacterized protein n=1 Tax=Liparis tanakae TaxID=230148 RepID=A0A4Z2FLF7_9TELE|nr:hypothetical protein EYF80_048229 [Liparis tanakae]